MKPRQPLPAHRLAALAMACTAPLVAAQTATTGRAIAWGAPASTPLASPPAIRSAVPSAAPGVAPMPTPAVTAIPAPMATPIAAPPAMPSSPFAPAAAQPLRNGAAATSAAPSARLARPDAAALSKVPVKVIRVPASRAAPPSGSALAAANAQVLAEAHSVPARSGGMPLPRPGFPPSAKLALPGSSDGVKLAAPGAADAATTCIPGNASAPKGLITPGGRVSMRGCDLGGRPGEMRMLGQFPGGMVKLRIEEWTAQLVVALVPAELSGVTDQEIRMQLVPAAGTPSKEQPGFFQARRETVALPDSLVTNLECAHPQPSDCKLESLLGTRWALGSHSGKDSQQGRDVWRLSVGRAWELDHIEHRPINGSTSPTAQAPQGDQQIVNVDWGSQYGYGSSENGLFHATYMLRFFVSGPAGVPFTAGLR